MEKSLNNNHIIFSYKMYKYSKKELRDIIMESSKNEFKPVVGKNVESDNKKNNEKSYEDIKKETGVEEYKRPTGKIPEMDYNKGLEDLSFDVDPDDKTKERWKAHMLGYDSVEAMKRGEKDVANVDYEGNKLIYDAMKKHHERISDEQFAMATAGIQGHNLKQDGILKKKPSVFKESIKPKRLSYKRTKFLNENEVLNRIPEEYKKDGQLIYVNDCADNEFIVECKKSAKGGFVETTVISHTNKTQINEQMDKIEHLFNYKVGNNFKQDVQASRINECKDDGIKDMLKIVRGLNNEE